MVAEVSGYRAKFAGGGNSLKKSLTAQVGWAISKTWRK
jgi:hypothetical protein